MSVPTLSVQLDEISAHYAAVSADIERDIRRARILRRIQIGLVVLSFVAAFVQGIADAAAEQEASA